jgi:hypothetical protein
MSKESLDVWLLASKCFENFLFDVLTLLILGDHNFIISNMFLTIFNALDVPRQGF